MALIECKECGEKISSKAKNCPKCGIKVDADKIGFGGVIFLILLAGFIISLLIPNDSANQSASLNSNNTAYTANTTPPPFGSQWNYSSQKDTMSKGTTYFAMLFSTNTVDFKFPYNGEQKANLTLRTDPKYGKDILFGIEKGQILCPLYDGCTVLVRFDEQDAIKFSASSPSDNSTDTIFIKNYSKFVDKMMKAKMVRISLNIYQEGSPVFSFDVSGFDSKKYIPK